jgi:GNAT superfamily N-acetyltransferase
VVGCGGWRRLGPELAELKRFYIIPAARGRGLAGCLVRHVEDHARNARIRTLWLETGEAQPEALAPYRGHGEGPIPL